MSMRSRATLVCCLLALAAGCNTGEAPAAPAAPESPAAPEAPAEGTAGSPVAGTGEGRPLPPSPPPALPVFATPTLRQEELRGIALSSLEAGDVNRSVAALISLMETPEMSDLKASGMLLLAELYHNEGNSERALAVLGALIEGAPAMAEVEFVMGRTLGELNRTAEAETHLRTAIALNPDFLQSYILLGSLLVADERQAEAEPVFVSYERALAGVLARLGDTGQALPVRLQAAETLATATPDSRITQALMSLLNEDSVAMQATAIQLLAEVGTDEAVPALVAYAGRATHEELQAAATLAAQRIGATHQ